MAKTNVEEAPHAMKLRVEKQREGAPRGRRIRVDEVTRGEATRRMKSKVEGVYTLRKLHMEESAAWKEATSVEDQTRQEAQRGRRSMCK